MTAPIKHTHIYKIHPSNVPLPISPSSTIPKDYTLPPSPLDLSSQYIHLSTPAQIPRTLARFFASPASQRDSIFLLKVPVTCLLGTAPGAAPGAASGTALGKELETEAEREHRVLRWETPSGAPGTEGDEDVFPHLYFADGRLGLCGEEVEGVVEVVSEVRVEGWAGGLAKLEGWLV